jgi:hypothetical protein
MYHSTVYTQVCSDRGAAQGLQGLQGLAGMQMADRWGSNLEFRVGQLESQQLSSCRLGYGIPYLRYQTIMHTLPPPGPAAVCRV